MGVHCTSTTSVYIWNFLLPKKVQFFSRLMKHLVHICVMWTVQSLLSKAQCSLNRMLPLPEGTLEGTIMSSLFTVQIKKLRPPKREVTCPTATLLVIDWGTVRIEFRSSTDFEILSSTFLYSSNYPFSLCYEAPKFVHFKSNYVHWQCLLCFIDFPQNLANLFVEMGWWSKVKNVTVAIVTSVKMSAAMMQTSQRGRNASWSLGSSAGTLPVPGVLTLPPVSPGQLGPI